MLARQVMPEMTFEEYLEWEAKQDEKWELVRGRPVRRSDRWHYDPVTGMAGATRAHNRIISNLLRHLGNKLAGGPCWASPSDLRTQTEKGARYPDVVVECGSGVNSGLLSVEARIVFEVLSPSNTFPNLLELLDEYQRTPAIQQVVYVSQDRPNVLSWTRQDPFWPRTNHEELDSILLLPSLGLELPLSEIYEGLDFEAAASA